MVVGHGNMRTGENDAKTCVQCVVILFGKLVSGWWALVEMHGLLFVCGDILYATERGMQPASRRKGENLFPVGLSM